jgi:serine/threonine protein kinase
MSLHFNRLADGVCYPQQTVECLDDNAASEFVSGALSGGASTKVEAHLAGCRECRSLVAMLAGTEEDSQAATRKHEKLRPEDISQVAKRPQLSIGDRVGRYLVLSTLGAGGMGVVFSAYDPQLDRKVALKLLRANLRGPSAKEARTRLKREAQAIAQLSHPNVVGVYDVGTTEDGDVYIAMEFVEGDTLTSWLKRWPRTWREILEVFHQAARGLAAAHTVGLLHRDFKPDNVLVGGDGRVRVTDFGLARSVLGPDEAARPQPDASALHADLTATGTVLGTPRYMPPEQLTGPAIDARADQFSFCVALYEALYSKHPLEGATSVAMLESGARAALPPDGTRVPSSIGKAVLRGLDRDRNKRFATMAALMHELQPPPQRSPVRFAAMAAIGLVLVGGATAAVVTRPDPTRRVEPNEEATLKTLIDEINKRDVEIKSLRQRLLQGQVKVEEVEKLKKQLDEKQEEVDQLTDQVTQLRVQQVQGRPPPRPPQDKQILAAIQGAQGPVQGCFEEWDDRAEVFGSGKPRLTHDADMIVEVSIAPDGHAYDQRARGVDSVSLQVCVADAVAMIRYPKGPDHSDMQVQIAWDDGNLAMTGTIVSHRAPSSSNLEGI